MDKRRKYFYNKVAKYNIHDSRRRIDIEYIITPMPVVEVRGINLRQLRAIKANMERQERKIERLERKPFHSR